VAALLSVGDTFSIESAGAGLRSVGEVVKAGRTRLCKRIPETANLTKAAVSSGGMGERFMPTVLKTVDP
jgi:hypothetical protein